MRNEVRKTTSFVKKEMQSPVAEAAGWRRLHVEDSAVKHVQQVGSNKMFVLTHIQSILYPLDDVKGVLHVAIQDVKLDVITA